MKKENVNGVQRLFKQIKGAEVHPDEMTYTSLINLFVKKEDEKRAYGVFKEMKDAGVQPDEVT